MRLEARVAVIKAADKDDNREIHEVDVHVECLRRQERFLDLLVRHVERGIRREGDEVDGLGIVDDRALYALRKDLREAADLLIAIQVRVVGLGDAPFCGERAIQAEGEQDVFFRILHGFLPP